MQRKGVMKWAALKRCIFFFLQKGIRENRACSSHPLRALDQGGSMDAAFWVVMPVQGMASALAPSKVKFVVSSHLSPDLH